MMINEAKFYYDHCCKYFHNKKEVILDTSDRIKATCLFEYWVDALDQPSNSFNSWVQAAMDVAIIPTSSCSVERVFSTHSNKNKCNLRRNSLPDKYQVELMIYHNTDKRRNENEYIQKNRIEVI